MPMPFCIPSRSVAFEAIHRIVHEFVVGASANAGTFTMEHTDKLTYRLLDILGFAG